MIKVGLTGGIGSGKSLVSTIFNYLGVPVYDSDTAAKKLYHSDSVLKQKLIDKFGQQTYLDNGQLNRTFLGNLVFNDKKLLNELNMIVHPRVKNDFENWILKWNKVDYIIKEAAILIESGVYKQVDKIIVVSAPMELRINRVIERDRMLREEVIQRIKNQLSEEELINYADFVIINDNEKALLPQILHVHQLLSSTILPVCS